MARVIGILGFMLGQCIAKPLLVLIQTLADILASITDYLRIYFCGYPFLLLYDFGSAILRAKGDSRYPFIALTITGFINVCLNFFFVVIWHWGCHRGCHRNSNYIFIDSIWFKF